MTIEAIIQYLKESLFIVNSEEDLLVKEDPEYIYLTDSYLQSVLQTSLAKFDSSSDFIDLGNDNDLLYPVILLAKREVYVYLATKTAPMNDLSVGNSSGSTSVKKSQRFEHYYKLIELVDKEYNSFLEVGSNPNFGFGNAPNSSTAGELLTDSRYFSQRNYNLSKRPKIRLRVDRVTDSTLELSWNKVEYNKFLKYEIYHHTEEILDLYEVDDKDKINKSAVKLATIFDPHQRKLRVKGLQPNTQYFVLACIHEHNGAVGYYHLEITTEEV